MCVHVCVCEDKMTIAVDSKLSLHQVRPLINVPCSPKDRRKKEQQRKGREKDRKNKRGRRSGWESLSQQILKVNVVREQFCLQRVFFSCVFFFTSKCCPAFSSWRSGGDRGITKSSHPRTLLLSWASSPLLCLRPGGKRRV